MIDEVGLWVSIGVMVTAVSLIVIFAMYKQYFGVLVLPELKQETATANVAETDPAVPSSGQADAYQQTDETTDGIKVELHPEESADKKTPPGYVYEQAIELETST